MNKRSIKPLLLAGAATLIISSFLSAQAQTRDKFVISAKAGGINAVTGPAMIHARGSSEAALLTIKEDLEAGDVVTTGIDGRVEMLLNPGSYFRLGENSEFELANNSLENLEVRLVKGTAIVEATGADDTELSINITTPHARLAIVRRGLYRVNVIPGDTTELIVRKGRVMLGDDSHTKIKGGNKVVFSNNSHLVAKLSDEDKKRFDEMDAWSKQRGKTLAQANRRMRDRDLNLLVASLYDRWPSRFPSRSWGLWLFDARSGCYTFLPFYLGWGSPYGSYSNAFFGDYYCCGRRYGLPGFGTASGGTASSGGGGASGSTGGTSGMGTPGRIERHPTPIRPAPTMSRMPDSSSSGRGSRAVRAPERQP